MLDEANQGIFPKDNNTRKNALGKSHCYPDNTGELEFLGILPRLENKPNLIYAQLGLNK